MRKLERLCTVAMVVVCLTASSQIKRTSVPLGDAVDRALEKGLLTGKDARPFHIFVKISEPENPKSPYQGTIEEWWVSSEQWHREITAKDGMRQMIVVVGGKKTERDEGDYFPLWLRNFVAAVFDPIPNVSMWKSSGMTIDQITMPNGDKSQACARGQSKVGTGDKATDAFFNVCFDGKGRLEFYGSPRYSMEFHDYRDFGNKQVASKLISDPEPGTRLIGEVTLLEDESKAKDVGNIFTLLGSDEDRFRSVEVNAAQMEQLSANNPAILWPPVRSGSVRGRLAMYISVDREGRVREAWPLNSDNAGLEDPARNQVKQWKLKPAVDQMGQHVQIDGGLGFSFETKIGDPLPQLTDSEIRALATKVVEPIWPAGSVKSGDGIEAEVSVNEDGKLTGVGFSKVPNELVGPINVALSEWIFNPLVRDGKPQYFHGTVRFVVR